MKNSLHIWNFGSIVTVSSEWLHHLSTVDLRSHDLSVVNIFFTVFPKISFIYMFLRCINNKVTSSRHL